MLSNLLKLRKTELFDLWIIVGVVVLAWWPLLISRPLVADDFSNAGLIDQGLGTYWNRFGIWRILGHPVPFIVEKAFPFGDQILAIVVHLVTVILFQMCLRRIGISRSITIAATLFLAVVPFGFQALTWNSAMTFAISTLFYLVGFLTISQPARTYSRSLIASLLCGISLFLSLSANEATLLLVSWLVLYPLVDFLSDRREGFGRSLVSALILLTFQVGWVGLHLGTKSADFHKNPKFEIDAILSGLFYQYKQTTYLIHLPEISQWLPTASWLSFIGLCALLLIAVRTITPSDGWNSNKLDIFYFSILPLAAVAIYSLGGGFSLDARKAYVIWPFILISASYLLQVMSRKIQLAALFFAFLCCPVFMLSTHATVYIWSQTGTQFEAAYRQIIEENIPGPYRFVWQPNIYEIWPDFELLCGFRFDTPWVVNTAVGKQPKKTDGTSTTLTLRGDQEWIVSQ